MILIMSLNLIFGIKYWSDTNTNLESYIITKQSQMYALCAVKIKIDDCETVVVITNLS